MGATLASVWRQLLQWRQARNFLVLIAIFALISTFLFVRHSEDEVAVKKTVEKAAEDKVILLWTPWFDQENWDELFEQNKGASLAVDENNPQGRRCLLSTNRSLVSEADALIFHARDFTLADAPMQNQRRSHQRWIFLSMEPPPMTYDDNTWQVVKDSGVAFNWTASYSSKAEIYFPYGRLLPINVFTRSKANKMIDKIMQFVSDFAYRKKDAIWIVSHCETGSKREEIVKQLQQHGLTVDIFGKCSGIEAPPWNSTDELFANYRYYLSFENSLCDDYISEKLFRGLKLSINFGVIPVAYHSNNVDYAKTGVLPESFINVNSFLPHNISGLAQYLRKTLPRDLIKLSDRFKWQLQREFGPSTFLPSWRNLCRRLWETSPTQPHVVDDVRESFGTCARSQLS